MAFAVNVNVHRVVDGLDVRSGGLDAARRLSVRRAPTTDGTHFLWQWMSQLVRAASLETEHCHCGCRRGEVITPGDLGARQRQGRRRFDSGAQMAV